MRTEKLIDYTSKVWLLNFDLGPFGATFFIVSHDLVPPSCGVGHMPTTIGYVELLALLEMRIDQVDQI